MSSVNKANSIIRSRRTDLVFQILSLEAQLVELKAKLAAAPEEYGYTIVGRTLDSCAGVHTCGSWCKESKVIRGQFSPSRRKEDWFPITSGPIETEAERQAVLEAARLEAERRNRERHSEWSEFLSM